ncbi:uncharacterized protein LOC142342896 isoform X2 [Convolutriloba macropyga]|uniref:uncharacterized protein LOC142342896 isoform X2 n=1 Tax=Convolutriloba macropyga TaxID=536237 RepID=UPI003F51E67E
MDSETQFNSTTSKTEAKLKHSSRAPDADSGIEDEDPNSPPSNSPHSNTPSSTTHLKPNGNGHVTLSSHRSLSPSTSYNELLDARTPACLESYSMEGVDQHNLLRRMHGTPPIAHSRELQKIAQNYADYLAEARIGEEIQKSSNFQIYGENILYIPYVCFMSAKQAVQLWYRQIRNIDLAEVSEERFNSISSFCQIVWRNTEALGIGVSFGRRGGCYIVANYYPKMELTLKNFFLNVPPPNTPMSVREEQYELWSSLRITYQNEEDGMSNANQDTLHVELTTVGANRLQKTWDMAVAVETVKKRLLSNPNSNASSRSTSPSRQ